ncbi:MAG TPA: translocation/assembly module TamB domain-containing protein [Candidatus Acidoferrales bacterium]|nr:translocation/assembly module TamB domain-containing protein [Candidatus Acidoferrales bacterium]
MPWVLRPVAERLGVKYARFERAGYQQFRLTGVALTNDSGRFEAGQVEAFVPTVWLWRCFVGSKSAPFLGVDSWSWQAGPAVKREQTPSAYRILQTAGSQIGLLEEWLPRAELSHGALRLKGQTLQIPDAVWADGKLSAQLSVPRYKQTFHLLIAAQTLSPPKLKINLDANDFQFHSRVTIAAIEQKLQLQGTAFWLSNQVEFGAELPAHGFLPQSASVRVDDFQIPAPLLKLKRYQDLTGSLDASWQSNRFALNLAAKAAPRSAKLPPIRIETRASGDTNRVEIDVARISTPWLDATLSRPALILFRPPYLAQPATVDVTADLAEQSWFAAKGKLAGEAIFQPGAARFPKVSIALDGAGLSMSDVTAKSLQLKGDIRWPATNSATFQVEGLKLPHSKPLRLEASWQGRGMDLRDMELALSAGASSLQMRGSAQLAGEKKKLEVTGLELSRSNRVELQLPQPFELAFERNAAASSNWWALALQPVQLSGENGGLQLAATVAWPETGNFQIYARDLNSSLVQDFFQVSTPEAGLKHLTLAGGWTNSPVAFHLDSLAEWKAGNKFRFEFNAQVSGGDTGIDINRLGIFSATQAVCQVNGRLPLILGPGGTNGFIRINLDGPLRLQASTQTNSILWKEIAGLSGLSLVEPQLTANVSGTWARPRGEINLRARSVQFPQVKHPLPTLEKIDLAAEVNQDEANISRFDFLLQGQPIQFTAQVPLGTNFWSTLASQRRLPDWREAAAQLKIENARLAPFANLLPGILSPQGRVQADIALQPGENWKGVLAVTDAATLPLGNFGAVRNIQTAVVFHGQTADLTNFSAAIGGQTVTADGRINLNPQSFRRGALPPFVIHLRGINVPLVRQPSLLLRADLALAVTNSTTAPPVVAGAVTLQNSLFLASLQSLIPENASTPKEHFPYFSVIARPWADWQLNLQVKGSQFMQVQTPVFRGKISAALRLQGTLKNPLAVGEIKIASGTVTFPFGSLDVNQGFVSLTTDNPYHPRLFITAQAQQFGYNITMEVSGTADAPVVQFSSTPPLSSQDIVLMLTTGQLPAGLGVSTTTQQRAQGLAVFFGRSLLSEFGLGLGLQNRLTIHSGQQISEEGRPTYEVDYRLSKRWTLVGEYDQFDQYDLNLKWNIYSR